MASLAPGNGWFPNRNPERSHEPRQKLARIAASGESNVYEFPPPRLGSPVRPEASRGFVGGALASLLAQSSRNGRSTSWFVGWCVFGLALASLAWFTLIGALFAAALIFGVPWVTAALAFGAAHALAAALLGVRISRTLLRGSPGDQRR